MTPATIKSAQRTLSIFELFADLRKPARVNELHRRLDLPQSSTSKLLRTFAKLGYLQYDDQKRTYFPTLRVALLGSWLQDQWFGHDSLLAVMNDLRNTMGTSVLLGIQNDKHVLYMTALEALVQPRPHLDIGTLRPICRAAVGKALLLNKSDHEIGLLVRRINAEEPNFADHVNLADLQAEISEARHHGYTQSNGAIIPGTGVIAMPLPKLEGQPAMGLGAGAGLDWLEHHREDVADALRSAIAKLAPGR